VATISTRLTNAGTLLVNGAIDEVTYNTSSGVVKNLLAWSEYYTAWTAGDQSGWFYNTSPNEIVFNATVGPMPGSLAGKLIDMPASMGSQIHRIYNNWSQFVAGTVYTLSIYAKAAERTQFILFHEETAGRVGINVDLSAGTASIYNGSPISYFITYIDNGWYRVGFTFTATQTGSTVLDLCRMKNASGLGTYVGDGASGMYLWGAQLEASATATAYQGNGLNAAPYSAGSKPTPLTPVWATKTAPDTVYATGNFDEVTYNSTVGISAIKNILTYSQQFAAGWSSGNITSTSNAGLAPDGSQTANKLTENTANNRHIINIGRPVAAGALQSPYTFSAYAKADTRGNIQLVLKEYQSYVRQASAIFNVSTGTIGTTGGFNGATLLYSNIADFGSGWYRCSMTANLGSTETLIGSEILIANSSSVSSYTGDGTSSIYVWGAQTEAGNVATVYQGVTTGNTLISPNFARREDRTGNMYVTNSYDEFTGAPVIDSSVVLWLDPTQTASYSGTGTTWTDLSTAQNNGTLTSSTSFDSITGGGSFNFAGTNYATLAANLVSSGSRTITMAFKPTDNVNRSGVISNRDGVGGWFVCINRNGAQLLTYSLNGVSVNNDLSANVISQTNVWYLATITHDAVANIGNIYLNGNLSVSATMGTIVPITTLNSYVGREVNSGQNFPGWIGDVIVYNRALTADEATQNYNALRRRYNL